MDITRCLRRGVRLLSLLMLTMGGASLTATASGSAACTAQSGSQTVALVELFTSEGCSSCPPADRWLRSAFGDSSRASAVALAFHVDYWDRLGWKDRFASAAFTERQYQAMHANKATFVYTPQVLVQGKPIEDWNSRGRGKGATAAIAAANALPAHADIALEALAQQNTVSVRGTARIRTAGDREHTVIRVALVQNRLASEVKAGENAGARLEHDHVVRALVTGGTVDGASGAGSFEVVLPVPSDGATESAVVAFVQNSRNGEVLQTIELPLSPRCNL